MPIKKLFVMLQKRHVDCLLHSHVLFDLVVSVFAVTLQLIIFGCFCLNFMLTVSPLANSNQKTIQCFCSTGRRKSAVNYLLESDLRQQRLVEENLQFCCIGNHFCWFLPLNSPRKILSDNPVENLSLGNYFCRFFPLDFAENFSLTLKNFFLTSHKNAYLLNIIIRLLRWRKVWNRRFYSIIRMIEGGQ